MSVLLTALPLFHLSFSGSFNYLLLNEQCGEAASFGGACSAVGFSLSKPCREALKASLSLQSPHTEQTALEAVWPLILWQEVLPQKSSLEVQEREGCELGEGYRFQLAPQEGLNWNKWRCSCCLGVKAVHRAGPSRFVLTGRQIDTMTWNVTESVQVQALCMVPAQLF